MDLQELLTAFGYGQGGLGTSGYDSAVTQGRTATADPQRAGITPGPSSPRVLAQLSSAPPIDQRLADIGGDVPSAMPVAPQDQTAPSRSPTQWHSDEQFKTPGKWSPPPLDTWAPENNMPANGGGSPSPPVQRAQYAPPMPMGPQMAPQALPSPMMPQSLPTSGNPYSPLGINSDKYAKLLDAMFGDVANQQQNRGSDALLRFGLATMAAGGKPMSTTLGAIGEGGLAALNGMDEGRAAQLKALLGGAQISNVLGEAALRGNRANSLANPPPVPGSGGGSPAPILSGSGVSPNAPQGPLGPNMTKIAGTLTELGHTPEQIAGALGWNTLESPGKGGDVNTRALNDTGKDGELGGSYGWSQWLGDRRDQLKEFAKANDSRVDDPVTQAKFFDYEMRQPGSGAGAAAQQAYWNAQTPAQAVTAMAHFSRGKGYSEDNPQATNGFDRRLAVANKIYGAIGGSGGGAPAQSPASAGGDQSGGAAPNLMDKTIPGTNFTPNQAAAYADWAERSGLTGEAAYWRKFADPEHNPAVVGLVQGAKEAQKIEIDRHTGWVTKGGKPMYRLPQPTEAVDPNTGAAYPSQTPMMTMGPNGQPVPVGGAPGGPPGAITGVPNKLGPAQVENIKAPAVTQQEEFKDARKTFGDAQTIQMRLGMMDHAVDVLNQSGWSSTGSGAHFRVGAAKDVNSFFTAFGMKPLFDPEKVATWEDFNKETTQGGFALARTLGSREAMQIVQQATSAVPNAELTETGARLVSASLSQAAQRQIDFYKFMQDWRKTHQGSLEDADIAFQERAPTEGYTSKAIAVGTRPQLRQWLAPVPPQAFAMLKSKPETAPFFNQKYGGGLAEQILAQ